MKKIIKGYKAFDFDWTCRGKKYVGPGVKTKQAGKLDICKSGIHCCEKISDVLKYYPLLPSYKFAEVEAYGEVKKSTEDSKFCASEIKIVREITFNEVINLLAKELRSSDGVSDSYGVSDSTGVRSSDGVCDSYGVKNCDGVSHALFCANLPKVYRLFNKEVSEERFNEVKQKIAVLMGAWRPAANNHKELYLMVGSNWEKVPLYRSESKTEAEMYADMPKDLIEYLKSLPEFDAKIFKEITGK